MATAIPTPKGWTPMAFKDVPFDVATQVADPEYIMEYPEYLQALFQGVDGKWYLTVVKYGVENGKLVALPLENHLAYYQTSSTQPSFPVSFSESADNTGANDGGIVAPKSFLGSIPIWAWAGIGIGAALLLARFMKKRGRK